MNSLSLEELMLCAKLFAYAMGDRSITLNQMDKDLAVIMLKRMADQKWNWTEQQKVQYKMWLDTCKHLM